MKFRVLFLFFFILSAFALKAQNYPEARLHATYIRMDTLYFLVDGETPDKTARALFLDSTYWYAHGWNGHQDINWDHEGTSPNPPPARSHHAAVHWNGKLYIIGGQTANGLSKKIWEYNPATKLWTDQTCNSYSFTPRKDMTAVVFGNKLYIMGGVDSTGYALKDAYVVDMNTFSSTRITDIPGTSTATIGSAGAALNGYIYMFGGYNNEGSTNSIVKYNPSTQAWAVNPNPATEFHAAFAAIANVSDIMAFLWGGSSSSKNINENSLYLYNAVTDTKTLISNNIPAGEYFYCGNLEIDTLAKSTIDTMLYFWGGDDGHSHFRYSMANDITEKLDTVSKTFAIIWNGESDTDWDNINNWETDMAPISGTDVIIPTGKSIYPTLTTTKQVNNFLIHSDSAGTGSFIGAEYLQTAGTATVERYIGAWTDAAHGWHYLSSPVSSQNISPDFVDITQTPISSDVDLYRWSESENLWISIKDTSGNYNRGSAGTNFSNDANPVFEPGTGYLIAYSSKQTKSFTGTLNSDDVAVSSLSYSAASGWHLLGNPYQSALYWNKTAWGLTNIDGAAKIWNESSASYTDLAEGTGIIPAMQGFMVHVNASTGSLTIKASDRTHSTTAWHKDTPVNTIKLTAIDPEGNTAQECIIRFADDATTGFDTQYDSHFLQGYAPQFYAVGGNNKLSTDALPPNTTEIPLSFIKNASTHFTIKAEGTDNLIPAEKVYLKDLKTGASTLLNKHPEYQFTSNEGDNPQRFMLLFAPVGIRENIVNNKIKVFSVNNRVEIRSEEAISASVNIYNVTGQKIAASVMHNQKSASVKVTNFRGFAVVSIIGNTFISTKKIVIQ